MTETAARPGVTGELLYAEDKSGLERRLVIQAVLAPAAFLAIFTVISVANTTAVSALLVLPGVAAAIWAMVSVLGLVYVWPIGVRIDSAGIRIGGLRGWERRQRSGRWPPRKPFHVGAQGRAVFTCPWEGVRELYLIDGMTGFRPLIEQRRAFRKRTSQLRTPLGMLSARKAGLVIITDPSRTGTDPGAFRANRSQIGPVRGVTSPTWLVPTRNPRALRAALARTPGAPLVQDHLPPGRTFAFYHRLGEEEE